MKSEDSGDALIGTKSSLSSGMIVGCEIGCVKQVEEGGSLV